MPEPTLTITRAELPATLTGAGEDRACIGRDAVVVLDGASGTDTHISVSAYVDHLAGVLIDTLDTDPRAPLRQALAEAIQHTAATLNLAPSRSPSATVSILRYNTETVDVLVLGDSPVYVAHDGRIDRLTDDRLARINLPTRTRLFERLTAGHGYDTHHHDLTHQLAREKAPHLNHPSGYWIAEATPEAGAHALVRTYPAHSIRWCALLTDGLDNPAAHLSIPIADLATMNADQLRTTLDRIHHWEDTADPDAKHLPRFKRHDDKTIVVVRFS